MRIWISRLYFSFSSRRCHSLLDMRVTTVREEPVPFFLSDVVFAQQFLASVSECGTPETWKEGPSSECRPLELGGVGSNPSHLTTWRETSATHFSTVLPALRLPSIVLSISIKHITADRCGGRRGISYYGFWSRRGCSRLMWSARVGCINPYSAYEGAGQSAPHPPEQLDAPFPPRSTTAASLLCVSAL